MLVSSLFAAVSVASMVSAQKVVPVQVGRNSTGQTAITFSPNIVEADVNDIVQFTFSGVPGNHTVTQSSFADPCTPVANGFDSGWVFNSDASAAPPIWNLTITNASTPIWFYCKQLVGPNDKAHCNLGMVGVINIGTKSFSTFLASASAAATVGQGEGGLSAAAAFATAAPNVSGPSQSLLAPSATAPPAGGSGGSASGSSTSSGSSPTQSNKSGALATGLSSATALVAALFGMALVL